MTDLNELARLLCMAVGASVPAEYGPERKLSVVADRVAETDAAELLIGFRARKPLNEGLFQMISSWEQRRSLARLGSI